eukprot:1089490-Amorphochlora_amoeboformis.AAC.1
MLQSDKEKLEAELQDMEQRLESKVKDSYAHSSSDEGIDFKTRLSEFQKQLEDERKAHDNLIKELDYKIKDSEQRVKKQESLVVDLKQQIAELPSREAHRRLKKRVKLLQHLGFNVIDPDIDGVDAKVFLEGGSDTDTDLSADELIILEEAKRLKAEITRCKVGWGECKEQLVGALEQLELSKRDLSKAKTLITKLEDDLVNAAATAGEAAVEDDDQPNEILSNALGSPTPKPSSRSTGSLKADEGMFKIICAQRDRFRNRIQQLESEQITAHKMRKDLQQQMKKLRVENIQLYEKLQYVRSYKGNPTDIESGEETKEEHVNPYQLFKLRQKEAYFNRLSFQEKGDAVWVFVIPAFPRLHHTVALYPHPLLLVMYSQLDVHACELM